MKRVDQTIFDEGERKGNCIEACVASILELELDEVTAFSHASGADQAMSIDTFVSRWGLGFVWVPVALHSWLPAGYHIIAGKGPREKCHAVVGYAGSILHDPHPSRDGLVKVYQYGFFVARIPVEAKTFTRLSRVPRPKELGGQFDTLIAADRAASGV